MFLLIFKLLFSRYRYLSDLPARIINVFIHSIFTGHVQVSWYFRIHHTLVYLLNINFSCSSLIKLDAIIEFGKIQKFSRQAGESNSKCTVVFSCKNQYTIMHFYIISKTHIAVFLCESAISCMLVCLPAQLAC